MQVNKNISKTNLNMVISLVFVDLHLSLRNVVCQFNEKEFNNREEKEFSKKGTEKQSEFDF